MVWKDLEHQDIVQLTSGVLSYICCSRRSDLASLLQMLNINIIDILASPSVEQDTTMDPGVLKWWPIL